MEARTEFKEQMKRSILLVTLSAILFTVLGCVERPPVSPFRSLSKAGPLPLSAENPYRGANLYLSQELEQSEVLRGFFEHRGAPAAIELYPSRGRGDQLYLYYPEDYLVYVGTLHQSRFQREWIIRGPYGMSRKDYLAFKRVQLEQGARPSFIVNGRVQRYQGPAKVRFARSFEPDVPVIPKPTPKPKPKKIVKRSSKEKSAEDKDTEKGEKSSSKPVAKVPKLDDPNFIPRNSDQIALAMSEGYAPRDENGDILHTVPTAAQTLENIADWYTGSTKNVQELRNANGFRDSRTDAGKGLTVRIPLKLIKQTKLMPFNHRARKVGVVKKSTAKKNKADEKPESSKEELRNSN